VSVRIQLPLTTQSPDYASAGWCRPGARADCLGVTADRFTVFTAAKQAISDMLYPNLLLLAGSVLVVCLGRYQRLSASVERAVERSGEKGGQRQRP
jgi:hypothetical protein